MKSLRQWLPLGLMLVSPLVGRALPVLSATDKPAATDKTVDAGSPLSVTDETQVPGKTLKKGEYTIRVVDHLSDRMIVEVDRNGKAQSTFLALPMPGMAKPAGGGPIPLSAGATSKSALRGFAFPDGTVAEFVYPKAEAVGLAKKNDTKIPAIDPDSQGLKGNPALSKQDREMVTLWLLSPTLVAGDSAPGIKAERYQAQTTNASVSQPQVESQASPQQQTVSSSVRPRRVAAPAAPAPQEVASVSTPPRPKAKPMMAALPHTAGTTPLFLLGALLALCGAACMTFRRLSVG